MNTVLCRSLGMFAGCDEYSQNRFYGTAKDDYANGNKVVALTPNGLRNVKQNCPGKDIFSVLVDANLGTRMKRYIDRCGVDKFSFEDKNEINARVERDFGMFLGMEKEVDLVIHNDEHSDIEKLAEQIIEECNKAKRKRGI